MTACRLALLMVILIPGPALLQVREPAAEPSRSEQITAWFREVEQLRQATAAEEVSRRTWLIEQLGSSGDEQALDYLGRVFESEAEWRDEVAVALAAAARQGRRREQDWRLLLRSLRVLDRRQAPLVYAALTEFRYKATRGDWQREVILRAARLDEAGQQTAFALLTHWTGVTQNSGHPAPAEELARWQTWSLKTYPESPAAEFPKLPENTRWTWEKLTAALNSIPRTDELPESGPQLFERASCSKCHSVDPGSKRYGPFGPGLREVFQRRQQQEILEAILYPSLHLEEEYPSTLVVTVAGELQNGLLLATSESGDLTLLQSDGTKKYIPREEIEEIRPQNISIMPTGLLEPLSLDEIRALLTWMRNVGSVEHAPKP